MGGCRLAARPRVLGPGGVKIALHPMGRCGGMMVKARTC